MPRSAVQGKLQSVQPVLPSRDVAAAIAWYCNRLGFELAFSDRAKAPDYAGIRRDSIELHLQSHDPAEWDRVERPMLRFPVENIASLYAEFKGKDVFHERTALRITGWGTEEFGFYDRDGNGLTFYRDLGPGERI